MSNLKGAAAFKVTIVYHFRVNARVEVFIEFVKNFNEQQFVNQR